MEFTIAESKEPFTLDEVMEFIDSLDISKADSHQLKCMIAEIADSLEKPERFREVKLNNGHHAIWDEEKKRLYHCYMDESFMRKIGIEVVTDEEKPKQD